MSEGITLYELAGLEDRRYSLFSWRARLALAHKGVEPRLVAVSIADKDAIAFSGQDKVPILREGGTLVADPGASPNISRRAFPTDPRSSAGRKGRRWRVSSRALRIASSCRSSRRC